MKLLSVIVPVYNAEKYLENCLNSIKNQTYSNFECLLINDGSRDNSEEICLKYVNEDFRFKYFKSENKGVASARNIGLDTAIGQYIAFVDSDDILEPNMYEILIKELEINDVDLVGCNYDKPSFSSVNIYNNYDTYNKVFINGAKDVCDNVTGDHFSLEGLVWNKVYKKEIIGNIKYRDLKFSEDAYFTIELLANNPNIKSIYIDKILYHYTQNDIQQNKTYNSYIALESASTFEKIINDFNFFGNESLKKLKIQIIVWCFNSIRKAIGENNKANIKIAQDKIAYYKKRVSLPIKCKIKVFLSRHIFLLRCVMFLK